MDNDKKKWRARVVCRVLTNNDHGQLVTLSTGDYTLSECGGARYELVQQSDNRVCLSLWFAEVLSCAHAGHVEILGMWP